MLNSITIIYKTTIIFYFITTTIFIFRLVYIIGYTIIINTL